MKIKEYFTPRSLVYTGDAKQKTTIKHFHYEKKLNVTNDFSKMDIKSYIQVIGLTEIEAIEKIKNHFNIDTLTLEDVFNVEQRVKIEDKQNYLFSVFHVLYLKEGKVKEDYLSMLLFKDTLISFHETEPIFLEPLYGLLEQYKELKENSIDFLYYQILDIITDLHLDFIDYSDGLLEAFEEDILELKKLDQEDFYQIRKQLLKLKGNTSPVSKELLKALKNPIFVKETAPYYDDLMDHLNRLEERLSEQRELTRHLLDLYMNNQSNQMNQVMKTLTLFSAIFIPLSFLTGFFGMNFKYFEALEYKEAIGLFIVVSVILVLAMIYYFKRKNYFK
ncbi:MAG: CorA family divalent cation transporter [Acholeplasma sp.]|nr:CorA family divalent cation transporter [Acholeplasma sp.]